MPNIRLSQTSGVPIYRQIVDQVRFLIDGGQLREGERLPSTRMLAANLGINRNTAAAAYAELRELGYVQARGRGGMVVTRVSEHPAAAATTRAHAFEILRTAIDSCLHLGLSPDEIVSLVYQYGTRAATAAIEIAFVECNDERAAYFARELERRLATPVTPLVLREFEPRQSFQVDLVLTTFFHLSEVRRLAYGLSVDVVGIVVAPHIQTLARIAAIPASRRVGIFYRTREQADAIRDSLVQAGLRRIEVLTGPHDERLQQTDAVIVPSEMPEMRGLLDERIEVIEFGNVLDEASVRMVRSVVEELRERKAAADMLAATGRVATA